MLNHLLESGLAENHFHLKGSPQVFPLTWICIMNHPERIDMILKSYGGFRNNLRPNMIWDSSDKIMSWNERLLYAAFIRTILFKRILFKKSDDNDDFKGCILSRYLKLSDVMKAVNGIRCMIGDGFRQLNNKKYCLDYAISSLCYNVDVEHPFRALSGERFLMYSCFSAQFRGELSQEYSDLLYIYILLKTSFRGELIQSNHRPVFDNFSMYQDRKDRFFEDFLEYETEGIRTAIRGQIEESYIESLEARIMPALSKNKMNRKIDLLDEQVALSYKRNNIDMLFEENEDKNYMDKYFYLVHFPKIRYSLTEYNGSDAVIIPRNNKCRKNTRIKAMALKSFLQKSLYSNRIHGIDACANEIGCRPETFATEFRYLRGEECLVCTKMWSQNTEKERRLGVTYHVGEDFIDIVDGLRAVDEAIRFLELRKADRIGHGLVLGVEPRDYYKDKQKCFSIYKQDFLDNILWLLDKSRLYNISIETGIYTRMEKIAKEIFSHIYGISLYMFFDSARANGIENYFDLYWDSWKLRGDHPDLYRSGRYALINNLYTETGYERYMKGNDNLDVYRNNPINGKLLFLYHFDKGVKRRGAEVINVTIEDWFIVFLENIMQKFRNTISELGIAIECNPTSNVLIGSFHTYENHPLFKFKSIDDKMNNNIMVSLNTDDLGVFDTSLANEYALIYSALQNKRRIERTFGETDIVNYMNELKDNGFLISFN